MTTDIATTEDIATMLVPLSAEDSAAFLAETTPATEEDTYSGFPRLTVHGKSDAEHPETGDLETLLDTEGNPLGAGSFHINGTDVYAKTVQFRPLALQYLYIKYDADFKLLGSSIYIPDFNREITDSLGTTRLGRPNKAVFNTLSEADQAEFKKNTPVHMHVFGLVYYEGGPVEGTLVDFRLGGKKWVDMGKFFKDAGYEHGPSQHRINLTLKQDKNGSNVYFTLVPAWDKEPALITPYDQHIAGLIQDHVVDHNDTVLEKHMAARKQALEDAGASDLVDAVFNSAIDITAAVDNTSGEEVESGTDEMVDDELPFDK